MNGARVNVTHSTCPMTASRITQVSLSQPATSIIAASAPVSSSRPGERLGEAPAPRPLAIDAEIGGQPVEPVQQLARGHDRVRGPRTSAAIPNARSPTSGLGSITSHGSPFGGEDVERVQILVDEHRLGLRP